MRVDGRAPDQIREIKITPDFICHAEGSVLIEAGNTKVICTASVEDKVPPFRLGRGGWVTAEYNMLPRATKTRNQRDISKLKLSGRSAEIQRLIGRALRAACNLDLLGERTITVDCDVIQADGGTRTASITGGFVALALACDRLVKSGVLERSPVIDFVSAISAGIVNGEVLLDLCYEEDNIADTDMNVVCLGTGRFVEIQGTGEHNSFSRHELNKILEYAEKGANELLDIQKKVLKDCSFGVLSV